MFEVTIFDTKNFKNVGPQFSVGLNEEYKTLTDALNAAADWISTSSNHLDLQVFASSVGFL